MKKVLDYILSVVFIFFFGLVLILFHGIQWFCFTLFGSKAHQKSVEFMAFFLVGSWYTTGSTVKFSIEESIPPGRPIIFIANHQSMFDIPGIMWFWRKHTPLFVSKKELANGIPSISYNLRTGKAALIDRKDGRSAIVEIAKLGKHIQKNNFSAVIFPEGTRSLNGKLRPFKPAGVSALLKKCPNALVVPIAIHNTGKFNPQGLFPIRSFTSMNFRSLKAIEPSDLDVLEIVEKAKEQIQQYLSLK